MTSLVQRFGRAARDPNKVAIGIVTLLAPPATTKSKYDKRPDMKEFVLASKDKKCRWKIISDRFNIGRSCEKACDVCNAGLFSPKVTLPPLPPQSKLPTAKSTEVEQQLGRQLLLAWRKKAYEEWAGADPPMTDGEIWILPQDVLEKLCEKLSHATTAKGVQEIARACKWRPMEDFYFTEIAQVTVNALKEAKILLNNTHASGGSDGS